jgi:hypothetical protein
MIFGGKTKETKKQKEFRFHREQVKQELEQAKKELAVAEYHFDNCNEVFFDVANAQLTVARKKVDLALMKAKLLQVQ